MTSAVEAKEIICKGGKPILFVKSSPHKLLYKMFARKESWLPVSASPPAATALTHAAFVNLAASFLLGKKS